MIRETLILVKFQCETVKKCELKGPDEILAMNYDKLTFSIRF